MRYCLQVQEALRLHTSDEELSACDDTSCRTAGCNGAVMVLSMDGTHKILVVSPHHKNEWRNGSGHHSHLQQGARHPMWWRLFHHWKVYYRELLYRPAPGAVLTPHVLMMRVQQHARRLKPGELAKLTSKLGEWYKPADCRHTYVTVVRELRYPPTQRDALLANLREACGGNLPAWVQQDCAKLMGNSENMWSQHYDDRDGTRRERVLQVRLSVP